MTPEIHQKLNDILDAGLTTGLGAPKPGELCVEAAICLALGEQHSDTPTCVHSAWRKFSIVINDSPAWTSPKARADGMRLLAITQLGTAGKDQTEWARRLALRTVREILPIALRLVVGLAPSVIEACEQAETLDAATNAAYVAANAAKAAATNAANAAAYAANAAYVAAAYAANAAAYAATNAAYAAANAAANAAAYAGESVLLLACRIAVECSQ